jgi:hypothetical protein
MTEHPAPARRTTVRHPRRILTGWVLAAAIASLAFAPLGFVLAVAGLIRTRAARAAAPGATALLVVIAIADGVLLLTVGLSLLTS